MGTCRGSGILRKGPQGWKIEQYHLSVTVPNDIMQRFIQLNEDFNKSKRWITLYNNVGFTPASIGNQYRY
ncbi:nuclear transport factor 2 family protein [Fulvivirgaceae bacterium PWU20]|uniref:Nuclear transport factor 2 family protein n=1 Tax=Chryseosolibacter indicus TaxID=2782351 RepID=A0ABS5VTU9_9BACT|nr:nuclear transport factor 2 family protein [Chryseosolibacter indicus]